MSLRKRIAQTTTLKGYHKRIVYLLRSRRSRKAF